MFPPKRRFLSAILHDAPNFLPSPLNHIPIPTRIHPIRIIHLVLITVVDSLGTKLEQENPFDVLRCPVNELPGVLAAFLEHRFGFANNINPLFTPPRPTPRKSNKQPDDAQHRKRLPLACLRQGQGHNQCANNQHPEKNPNQAQQVAHARQFNQTAQAAFLPIMSFVLLSIRLKAAVRLKLNSICIGRIWRERMKYQLLIKMSHCTIRW